MQMHGNGGLGLFQCKHSHIKEGMGVLSVQTFTHTFFKNLVPSP